MASGQSPSDQSVSLAEVAVEAERRSKRLDSQLEAEGAEFLVLGLLLVEGIQATKAYTRFPAYDLLAFNPDAGLTCRIQVKSRWATDYDRSFPIKNFDCDFVAHVALNRGYRHKRRRHMDGRQPPRVYILPVEVVQAAKNPRNTWGKVRLADMPDVEQYLDNWSLVRDFLRLPTV